MIYRATREQAVSLNFKVHRRFERARPVNGDFGGAPRVPRSLGPLAVQRETRRTAEESEGACRQDVRKREETGEREKGGPPGFVRAGGTTRPRHESERRWHVVGLEAFTRNISLTKNIQAAVTTAGTPRFRPRTTKGKVRRRGKNESTVAGGPPFLEVGSEKCRAFSGCKNLRRLTGRPSAWRAEFMLVGSLGN